jgi:hypothetical protein
MAPNVSAHALSKIVASTLVSILGVASGVWLIMRSLTMVGGFRVLSLLTHDHGRTDRHGDFTGAGAGKPKREHHSKSAQLCKELS